MNILGLVNAMLKVGQCNYVYEHRAYCHVVVGSV